MVSADTIRFFAMTRTKRPLALLLVLVLAVALAACGDDDDDTTEGGTGTGTGTEEQASGDLETYCEATVRIETAPEPDIDFEALSPEELATEVKKYATASLRPIVNEIVEAAPEELNEDITTLDNAVKEVEETGDFEAAFETEEVEAASDRVHAHDLENCGWGSTEVEGLDYSYRGIPAEIDAGVHSFEFTNAGKEMHMLGIIKKKAGTTETFDQLLELPEEEAEAKTEFLGEAFGPPGDDEYVIVNLTPGDYLAICFIPVGSTPEAGEDVDGPPHFTQGMKAEFTVS